jgi:hypothetical protein
MDFEALVSHVHTLIHDNNAWLPLSNDELVSYHYDVNHMLCIYLTQDLFGNGFVVKIKMNAHYFHDDEQRQWHKRFLLSAVDYHRYDKQIMCSIDQDENHCIAIPISGHCDEVALAGELQLLIEYSNKVPEKSSIEKEGGENWIAI